jgi:hypothetical protein
MKTSFSFGLIVAAAGTFLACSDEGDGECRTNCGGTGNVTANAGTGNNTGGTGTGTGGSAGSPAVGGAGGAPPSVGFPGTVLTINEDGSVVDPTGRSGINGAALLAFSPMNPVHMLTTREGALCISGETAIVPGTDYTNYWGAEIDLDLNRGANPDATDAGAAGDAGDAGAVLGTIAQPWDPDDFGVIGFSFKVEGQDPTIVPGEGVPAAFRFKTAPTGGNTSTDNFCIEPAPVHNGVETILFTQIIRDCWGPGLPSVFEDPAGFTAVQNIGWQIPASTTIAYRFNFCITELTPIFATAAAP